MQARFSASSVLHALVVAVACWVLADAWIYHGTWHQRLEESRRPCDVVARVGSCDISAVQIQVALREYLWRHQLEWVHLTEEQRQECRVAAVEVLVNFQKVRWSRLQTQSFAEHQETRESVKKEKAVLQRQFESVPEFHQRLAAAGETEKELMAKMNEAQLDEAWLAQASAKVVDKARSKAEAWYAENREMMRIPLRHHAAHLFLSHEGRTATENEQKIRRLYAALLAGKESFAQLATLHSDDARSKVRGGDLGWISRGRLPEDLMQAVEVIPVGRVSPPVKTRLGWHILWVLERRPSRLPTFAEVQHEVVAFLEAQAREAVLKERIVQVAELDVCIDDFMLRSLKPAL